MIIIGTKTGLLSGDLSYCRALCPVKIIWWKPVLRMGSMSASPAVRMKWVFDNQCESRSGSIDIFQFSKKNIITIDTTVYYPLHKH